MHKLKLSLCRTNSVGYSVDVGYHVVFAMARYRQSGSYLGHALYGEREMVALLSLSSWCLVIVVWLFLVVLWVCLQFCESGIS